MSQAIAGMAYRGFDPEDKHEDVLAVLKEGRSSGDPWGYTSVAVAVEKTGFTRQKVDDILGDLISAGWVEKPSRGFYKFVDDPRES